MWQLPEVRFACKTKGSVAVSCFLFAVCPVGRELQPGAEWEAGRGERGVGDRPAESKTQWVVLCFVAEMPRGRTGSSLGACWVCIPRCSPVGGRRRGHGENSLLICGASWTVCRVKHRLWWVGSKNVRENTEEAVLKTWNLLDKYFIPMVHVLWKPGSNF